MSRADVSVIKRTVFVNLAPGGASNDDSGILNVFNVHRMTVKCVSAQVTATGNNHYITSNMVNDVVGTFSGVANIQLKQEPIIFDFPQPVNFQGTYNFQFYSFAAASSAITGNVILHLEFDTY